LSVAVEQWPMQTPFKITGYTFTSLDVVVVRLGDGAHEGRGEGAGVYYFQDTPARMAGQIEAVRGAVEAGIDRAGLARLLPAGGARNALDCALWDLQAKRTGRPVWALAGLEPPRPLTTTYTVSADLPEVMAAKAGSYASARAIKLKLTGEPADAERVAAVRAARPDIWLGVDANQGFSRTSLARLMPTLLAARVELLEQPFPMGEDRLLEGLASPVPVAADESAQTLADVARLAGLVDIINIKLDKCGGLTEALAMAHEARRLGLKLMVGNMFGTALAMAPGFVVGQLCDVVDLDGPMNLVGDREPGMTYEDGRAWCPPQVWGSPQAATAARA
jgi:L-alanine-DL-glutamate epimerase-like enolase superfamily enzyme